MSPRRALAPRTALIPEARSYERDEALMGREARIEGRQGLFRIRCLETNPRTGRSWFVLYGGDLAHPMGQNQWHNVSPDRVKVVPLPRRPRARV